MFRSLIIPFAITLLTPLSALAQFDTDADCGAAGYSCLNGRHCDAGRCLPAWQDVDLTGAPTGSLGGAVVAIGDKVGVFGGCEPSQTTGDYPSATAGLYDPETDTWSAMASPNISRQYASSASGNGGAFLFGGLSGCYWPYDLHSDLEFSSDGSSWDFSSALNPPSPRYNATMTWSGSELFVWGGSNDYLPAMWDGGTLTPGNDWETFSSAEEDQRGGSYDILTVGGEYRIVGGLSGYGNTAQTISYDSSLDQFSYSWTQAPGPSYDGSLCSPSTGGDHDDLGRDLYLALDHSVWAYDSIEDSWSQDVLDWPSSLSPCASVAFSGGELFAWSGDGSQYGARYQAPAPGL